MGNNYAIFNSKQHFASYCLNGLMGVATQMAMLLMSFDETLKFLHYSYTLLKWKPVVKMCRTGAVCCLQLFKLIFDVYFLP